MSEILLQYKTLIAGLCIAFFLIIFRKELNKLIDWIISFKKLSKTNEGYSASTAIDSSGTQETEPPSKLKESLVEQTEVAEAHSRQAKGEGLFNELKVQKKCATKPQLIYLPSPSLIMASLDHRRESLSTLMLADVMVLVG